MIFSSQRVIMRARLRDAKILEDINRHVKVEGTPLLVNRSLPMWQAYKNGVSLVGRRVDVRIEQLLVDGGTSDARILWSARVIKGPLL